MATAASITTQIDPETRAMLDRIAERRGVTAEALAAEAIQRVTEADTDFWRFVQEGIDAADRGDLIPHEEVMAELNTMIEKHRNRCRS
jgi:predicted transcriptional regulator